MAQAIINGTGRGVDRLISDLYGAQQRSSSCVVVLGLAQ